MNNKNYIANPNKITHCNCDLCLAELGDYEDDIHTPGVISEFRFAPDSEQTEEMELEILERYKKCM